MLNTYLYFSEDGTLKEQIQAPVRAGGTNTNAIFVYWEGVNNTVSTVTVDYKDGVSGRVFDNHYVPTVPPVDPNPNCIIPFDSKRDLKYFKYYTQYNFYVFNIPAELLAGDDHPIVFDFKFVYTGGELVLGLSSVWCQGQAVKADQLITIAQWNYLTTQLTQYITAAEVANLYVVKINPQSSGTWTHTGDANISGDVNIGNGTLGMDGSDLKVSVSGGGKFIYDGDEVANEDYVDDNILDMTSNPMTLTDEQYAYASKANVRVRQTLNDGSKRLFEKAYETDTTFVFVCSRDEQIIPVGQDYKQRNLPMALLTKSTKVLATGNLSYNFYDKSQTDSKFGHSIEASVNTTNYVMTMTLKDANGNVLNTANVDLPLESIIVSAQYYATYTYDGTTYTNVIVITLATTSVPTIIPLGTLVSGLVDLTSNQNITGYKTFKYKITWQSPNGTYSSELRQADGGNFDFYLNGSVKLRYSLTNSNWDCFLDFVPHSNNTYNLGGASNAWKDVFTKNIKDGNGFEVATNNIAKDNAVVHLTGDETIDGNKKFSNAVLFGASDAFVTSDATYKYIIGYVSGGSQINLLRYRLGYGTYFNGAVLPMTSGGMDLGSSASYWRDLYLSGKWKDGTNEKSLQDLINDNNALQAEIVNLRAMFEETTIEEKTLSYSYLQWEEIPSNIDGQPIVFSGGSEMTNVKGNSCVVNQLVPNGNFADVSGWSSSNTASKTANNNILTVSTNDYTTEIYRRITNKISGHKYIYSYSFKTNKNIDSSRNTIVVSANEITSIVANQWYQVLDLKTAASSANMYFDLYFYNTTGGETFEVQLKNCWVIDLTLMGLDSLTTVDEVRSALLSRGINIDEYNQYNEGSIKNSKPTSLVVHRFNLWDGEYEVGGIDAGTGGKTSSLIRRRTKNNLNVVPNKTYYCKSSQLVRVFYYDKNDNYLGYSSNIRNNTFTTLNNTSYILFATMEDTNPFESEFNVNISNATLNGTYKPYQAPTEYALDLPILRSAGSVQDDEEKVRIGVIDLGSLNYVYVAGEHPYFISSAISDRKVGQNMICGLYIVNNVAVANMGNMQMKGDGTTSQIYFINNSYTDANAFKTAMSGVYLLYELETPTDQTAITLPDDIVIENGDSFEIVYDNNDNCGADFDFAVATNKLA